MEVKEYTALDFEHIEMSGSDYYSSARHGYECSGCFSFFTAPAGIYTCPHCGTVNSVDLEV